MPPNVKELKVVVDAMFGKLGRFLRLLGYDTKIADNALKDHQIMLDAIKENRMLVTRDLPFFERAVDHYYQNELDPQMVLYAPYQDLEHQLAVFFNHVGFTMENLDWNGADRQVFDSRCAKCNGSLEKVSKEEIRDQLPEGTAEQYDNFWQCQNPDCKGVYWVGNAPWEDIVAKIKSAIACKEEVKFAE